MWITLSVSFYFNSLTLTFPWSYTILSGKPQWITWHSQKVKEYIHANIHAFTLESILFLLSHSWNSFYHSWSSSYVIISKTSFSVPLCHNQLPSHWHSDNTLNNSVALALTLPLNWNTFWLFIRLFSKLRLLSPWRHNWISLICINSSNQHMLLYTVVTEETEVELVLPGLFSKFNFSKYLMRVLHCRQIVYHLSHQGSPKRTL